MKAAAEYSNTVLTNVGSGEALPRFAPRLHNVRRVND